MSIIAKKTELIKAFWIYFHLSDATAWIKEDIPQPTLIKHINNGAYIGYAVDGYFGTKKSVEFLNDIIARFLITFKDENIRRLPFKPSKNDLDEKTAHIFAKVYKLKEFSKRLNSLPIKKKYNPQRSDQFEDFTFWAIKLYAEDMIRNYGQISYGIFESWALTQFEEKDRSTIRAKCRNIYNWYEARNWDISTKSRKKYKDHKEYLGATMATRKEHITQLNRSKGEQNKRAVVNVITGLFADDYKKKSGAWHYQKIADQVGLSSKTVAKIIKNLNIEELKNA